MGVLDGILGNLSGATEGDAAQGQDALAGLLNSLGSGAKEKGAGLMASAMSVVQSHGGLDGILDKFRQNGMVEQVESWIGKGPNLPITAEQLHKVFDAGAIKDVAGRLGISAEQASQTLATFVPELVHRLTPEGKVPDNAKALIAEGLAKLKSFTA